MANLLIIRDLCEKKNLKITELAERLGMSDISIHSLIKKGRTNTETLEKIARILEVPVGYFFDDFSTEKEIKQNVSSKGGSKNIYGQNFTVNNPDYVEIIKQKDIVIREEKERTDRIIEKAYDRDKGKDDEIKRLTTELIEERKQNRELISQNMELVNKVIGKIVTDSLKDPVSANYKLD